MLLALSLLADPLGTECTEQDCWTAGSSPAVPLTQPCVSSCLAQRYEEQELLRLIYYGGIQPAIRKAVWPFLLGHYQFGMTEIERKEVSHLL